MGCVTSSTTDEAEAVPTDLNLTQREYDLYCQLARPPSPGDVISEPGPLMGYVKRRALAYKASFARHSDELVQAEQPEEDAREDQELDVIDGESADLFNSPILDDQPPSASPKPWRFGSFSSAKKVPIRVHEWLGAVRAPSPELPPADLNLSSSPATRRPTTTILSDSGRTGVSNFTRTAGTSQYIGGGGGPTAATQSEMDFAADTDERSNPPTAFELSTCPDQSGTKPW